MRVKFENMVSELSRVLEKRGFSKEMAQTGAKLFAENSLDGIYSHGVNRFPRVISYIDKGYINVNAVAEKVSGCGSFEQWDGNLGLGNLNAKLCMDRAIELAHEYGVGIVAIRNNNHWMRGGAYGWQAANAGCVGMCWTNTQPNMPAWGAKDRRIGNNPFIMSLPRTDGNHVVVDCAMAQFSYGKIEECRLKGVQLPVEGGFDEDGNATKDPAAIEKTWRVLPIGYWKGSGFSIALDLIAAVLSGGNTVQKVGELGDDEYALSQVLIAIDPTKFSAASEIDKTITDSIDYIKASEPTSEGGKIFYPGELEMKTRKDNLENGVPVVEEIWNEICNM